MAVEVFSVTSDPGDAFCYKTDAVYANVPTGTFNDNSGEVVVYATRETGYYIANGFFRFDTSALPDDATISSATLDVYVNSKGDADTLKLVGDWYDFGGSPVVSGDWANLDVGSNALEVTLASLTTLAVNNLTLLNPTSISLSGYTGIRLGISKLAADAAPTGFNGVELIAYEHLTISPASLTVTYTSSVTAPTLRTARSPLRW